MMRRVAGVVAGLIAWFFVATIGNRLLRVSWPSYAEAEIRLKFTLGMMAARLVLGALSSVCAGFVVAWITRSRGTAAKVLGIVLIAMFGLWDKFPIWYHMIFLVSLLPLTLAGAILKAQPDRPKTKIPANSRLTPKPDIKYALVWALLLGARFSSSRARGLSYLAL